MNSICCENIKIKLFLKIWIQYVVKIKIQIIFKNMNSICHENKKKQIIYKNMNSTCYENKKSNYF